MDRLETLSIDIAQKLRNASVKKKHDVIIAACEFAIKISKIEIKVFKGIIDRIRAGRQISELEKLELKKLGDQLDNNYFELQEAFEEGHATENEYICAFKKARTVYALLFAFEADSTIAALESVYEVASIADDKERYFSLIKKKLL